MKTFPHQNLTKSIIGIYYDVYNELGYGFLERVHHNAMILELNFGKDPQFIRKIFTNEFKKRNRQ